MLRRAADPASQLIPRPQPVDLSERWILMFFSLLNASFDITMAYAYFRAILSISTDHVNMKRQSQIIACYTSEHTPIPLLHCSVKAFERTAAIAKILQQSSTLLMTAADQTEFRIFLRVCIWSVYRWSCHRHIQYAADEDEPPLLLASTITQLIVKPTLKLQSCYDLIIEIISSHGPKPTDSNLLNSVLP